MIISGLKAVVRAIINFNSHNFNFNYMKKVGNLMILALMLTFGTTLFAQDRSYTDGSVWTVAFVKVSANMNVEYLNNLKNTWKAVHDEAVRQGLIVSYKILQGNASNPEDWDIMLMTEFKNLSAIDGKQEQWDAINKKIVGGEEASKKLNESRVSMRTIYGTKMVREVIYK